MVASPTTHRGAARVRHVAKAPGLPESTPPTVAPAHLLLIPPLTDGANTGQGGLPPPPPSPVTGDNFNKKWPRCQEPQSLTSLAKSQTTKLSWD